MWQRSRSAPWLLALAATVACDGGLEPLGPCPQGFVGVCGTIMFQGSVPVGTDLVWVVAFETFPQSSGDLFLFRPIPPPMLPLGNAVTTYQLPLPAGRYEWVLAVWKAEGTLTIENADQLLREAGFYRDPGNPTLAGVVTVGGGATGEIDFVVDFDNMHPVSFWFPPAAR